MQGGLFDQPASFVTRMKKVLQAEGAKAKAEESRRDAQERLRERTHA